MVETIDTVRAHVYRTNCCVCGFLYRTDNLGNRTCSPSCASIHEDMEHRASLEPGDINYVPMPDDPVRGVRMNEHKRRMRGKNYG